MTDPILLVSDKISSFLNRNGYPAVDYKIEPTKNFKFGDLQTGFLFELSAKLEKHPDDFKTQVLEFFLTDDNFESIEYLAGRVNFYFSVNYKNLYLQQISNNLNSFLLNESFNNKNILIEYTDPNPFKVFHIGHLMSNAIGESISRMYEFAGAKVTRACYQGDVGLHVAKAIYGIFKNIENLPEEDSDLKIKTQFLGKCYVEGSNAYEDDLLAKEEIEILNQKIYQMADSEIIRLYDLGKKWSLEHFEEIYQILGTKFSKYYFESNTAVLGQKIVADNLEAGVFIKSQGAIIFPGSLEKYKLHDRVFINSKGLPTYEAKEIGLNQIKKNDFPGIDLSVVITASEQVDYMKVVRRAWQEIDPENASKLLHLTHGMLRFAEGKMSSRKGNIISGEDLIKQVALAVLEKKQNTEMSEKEKEETATQIAVGAIKYSILKQSPGKDIIYDFEKSLSFEGDSGPYLQYSYVRARSLLEKAEKQGLLIASNLSKSYDLELENNLMKYPSIFKKAVADNSPNHLVTFAIEIARSFNSFYGKYKIIDAENPETSSELLLIVSSYKKVIESVLNILAIPNPNEM